MTRPLNPKEFARKLRELATRNLPRIILERYQKAPAIELISRTVLRTAVDRGGARANWQSSTAGFEDGVLDQFDRSGQDSINRGLDAISNLQPFGSYYLSNNLVYIVPLEEGSSKQAPAGMLRISVMEVETIFDGDTTVYQLDED